MDEPDIIPPRLLGRHTIARTWEMTPRTMMAFAAGVGDVKPCYFNDLDPDHLIGHPGMVYTFQFNTFHIPDVRLSEQANEFNIHAWTDVRYRRPFRLGDVLTAQARVIAVRQIRPGALTVMRLTVRDSRGETVAEADDGIIYPNGLVDGADAELATTPSLPEPGAGPPQGAWEREVRIAPEATHVYTETADIWDRFHTELTVASRSGLAGLILQGSATMSFAIRELVDGCLAGDPTRLRRIAGRFRAMVTPGRSMAVCCTHTQTSPDGQLEAFFEVKNHEGQPAIQHGVLVADA